MGNRDHKGGGKGSNQYSSKGSPKARRGGGVRNSDGLVFRLSEAAIASVAPEPVVEEAESGSGSSRFSETFVGAVASRVTVRVNGGGDAPRPIPDRLKGLSSSEVAARTSVAEFIGPDSALSSSKVRRDNLDAFDDWVDCLETLEQDTFSWFNSEGTRAAEEVREFAAGFYWTGARLMAKESFMASADSDVSELKRSFDGLRSRWSEKKTRQADRTEWLRGMQSMPEARRRGAVTAAAALTGWDRGLSMRSAEHLLGMNG